MMINRVLVCNINLFASNAPFLYPLKTSENHKVSWSFEGIEKWCIGNEWVNEFCMCAIFSE